jgi:hypothetical protein
MADVFEAIEKVDPTMWFVQKSGTLHVFGGRTGGLTRALCGTRPPMFGGDIVAFEKIVPINQFRAMEEMAPAHWDKLQRLVGLLGCDTCHRVMLHAVNQMWKDNGLDVYLPEGAYPMDA